MQGVHLGTYPFRTNIVNPHYLTIGASEPAHQSQRGILRISEGLSTSTEQILQQNPPFQKPSVLLFLIPYAQCVSSKLIVPQARPAPRICLSEVIYKPFALSRVFLLFSGGKSVLLVKKKASSRSGFPLSMYVALKTRYVNPKIHVRRY